MTCRTRTGRSRTRTCRRPSGWPMRPERSWNFDPGVASFTTHVSARIRSSPDAQRLVAYELKLPDLGEGLTEGEIARWLVAEGQEVAEDDPLVEIQTDKTTVEIPSPAAGKIARILVAEGEVVPVGTVLVVIGEPLESRPEQPPAARAQATPLVRKIAHELGVD